MSTRSCVERRYMERAAVIGLGVVGRTMLALGGDGVVGVDRDPARLDECRGLGFRVTDDFADVAGCGLVFVCVGTPKLDSDRQDTSQILGVLEVLPRYLSAGAVVAIRSTITPECLPEAYPHPIVVNPEFLREAHAMEDARRPPFVVVGGEEDSAKQRVFEWYRSRGVNPGTPELACTAVEAMLLKFASNWFHAVKVEFANVVGEIAEGLGGDPQRIMSMFARDRVLNVSERYLRPGEPFEGSCLPKDLDIGVATFKDVADVRLLESVALANRARLHKKPRD